MAIVNEITVKIIKNIRDGESIHSLANKIGFAYSAVYRWVSELEKYGVVSLIRKGNKNIIKINKNLIYKKFMELEDAVSVIEKDKIFWSLMKNLKLKVRFVRGTAATIWTQGSFVTGDFYDRIYFLEVEEKEVEKLVVELKKHEIEYTQEKIVDKKLVDLIMLNREGKIKVNPGYDGNYGEIIHYEKQESKRIKKSGQKQLLDFKGL